jgi:hypothetical protein
MIPARRTMLAECNNACHCEASSQAAGSLAGHDYKKCCTAQWTPHAMCLQEQSATALKAAESQPHLAYNAGWTHAPAVGNQGLWADLGELDLSLRAVQCSNYVVAATPADRCTHCELCVSRLDTWWSAEAAADRPGCSSSPPACSRMRHSLLALLASSSGQHVPAALAACPGFFAVHQAGTDH